MAKPNNWPDALPYLDERVRYVGTSELRPLNSKRLRELRHTLVVCDKEGRPMVVLMPYGVFMAIQNEHTRR